MTSADTAPGWPALIAARAAWRLSAGLLTTAGRFQRLPRMGLAVLWVSEQIAVRGRRMLTAPYPLGVGKNPIDWKIPHPRAAALTVDRSSIFPCCLIPLGSK